MQIAIKYCGGCNPRYDRTKVVKRFTEAFPEDQFKAAVECHNYDFLIIVCGCFSVCAAKGSFNQDRTFIIRQEDEFMAACEAINTSKSRKVRGNQ